MLFTSTIFGSKTDGRVLPSNPIEEWTLCLIAAGLAIGPHGDVAVPPRERYTINDQGQPRVFVVATDEHEQRRIPINPQEGMRTRADALKAAIGKKVSP